MRPLVRYTLKQAVFMNLVFIVLMVAGAFSILTTPVENMPPVDIGKVFVVTVYYGASAEDVESHVTAKIEDALDGMKDVEYVQSRSYRNNSIVEVKFLDDSDYEALYDELRFRVLGAQRELPAEADVPSFIYIDTQVWMPVIAVNLAGDLPNRSLALLADELKVHLIGVKGVRGVQVWGEFEPEFHVSLDPEKLRRFGITFDEAARAVESAVLKIPTGRLRTGDTEYMLDAGSRPKTQREVTDVVVRRDADGSYVRIADLVTSARLSHRDPDVISSAGGRSSMTMLVHKEAASNAIEIAGAVKAIAGEFEASHAVDRVRAVLTNDSTIEIKDSMRTLGGSMALGIVLVTAVLWYTLGFRSAMLAAVGIPFSFLCTMIFVNVSGQSINTISLFSFVLVSGIIVDDAVIILENIYRHQQMGRELREAIVEGTGEVMLPVISTAITTILAFLPMLIMTGSTGDFFSVIPKTVSFALAASLIEALFILPVHVLDWGHKTPEAPVDDEADGGVARHLSGGVFAHAWRLYYRALGVLLAHQKKAFAALMAAFTLAVLALVLSISGVVPVLKVVFFPGSYFRYHVVMKMPPGTAVEKTDEVVRELSEFVLGFGPGQAQAVLGTAGFYEAENYMRYRGHHHGQLVVTLPPESERRFPGDPSNDPLVYLDYVRRRLAKHLDEVYGLGGGPLPELRVFAENTGPPVGKPVNVRVSGNTVEAVSEATDAILAYMRSEAEFADLVDVEVGRAAPQRVAVFEPRLEAASQYGIAPGAVTWVVAGALNGRRVGQYIASGDEVDLMVRLARADDPANPRGTGVGGPGDVLDVPVVEHSAAPVSLRQLVDLQYRLEPTERTRYNGKPALTISAEIATGSKLSAGRVQVLVDRFARDLPARFPGVAVAYGGEFETTRRTYGSLMYALIIAVLCIYVVLATQFSDYLQPLIILTAIMFAVIGVVLGMFVTQSTFTIGSFMAMVGLAGVSVNDSLVLIDFINVRRRRGSAMRHAVVEACSMRMRPVLITTVTTILGLLPMAVGFPRKSIAWAPMATAFVTGLCSATILALLMIPVLYELSETFRTRARALMGRSGPA